jgi:hypothetical protein
MYQGGAGAVQSKSPAGPGMLPPCPRRSAACRYLLDSRASVCYEYRERVTEYAPAGRGPAGLVLTKRAERIRLR